MKYDHKYDDIIEMEHHISKKHPQMSLYARSAQFAPFAALTGYEDAVKETGREVENRIDIGDELKNILDTKIHILTEKTDKRIETTFTYFLPDLTKNGGKYINITGIVKKIDNYNQRIILEDKTEIPINEIIDISGEIFNIYE